MHVTCCVCEVLTVGGGLGRIAFFDLRASKYIATVQEKASLRQSEDTQQFVTVGEGWLRRDGIFEEFFQRHTMQHAVYTHAYDPSGTKLFVGGGPRYFGLTGSYAAVW